LSTHDRGRTTSVAAIIARDLRQRIDSYGTA